MTENHPITPPPELIAKWAGSLYGFYDAVQWGADQQLEHCVDWLDGYERDGWAAEQMRNDLRPKPPSLAEDALKALQDQIDTSFKLSSEAQERANTIRAALERLKELEQFSDDQG